ncbi:cytochrome P450 [Nonomuraea typhae]|uniref:Cytochrome P450 n=1 Tax=Nonomuraea typhae TaxID=2603600 RepID=A0ABW7YLD2_9ACTN
MAVHAPPASGKLPLLGHIPALALHRLSFIESVRHEGPVLRIHLGRTPTYLVNDYALYREAFGDLGTVYARGRFFRKLVPLLGNGLGTSDGPFHMRQRRMVQPAFHPAKPAYDAALLLEVVNRQTASWRPGTTVDLAREMDRLGVAVITKALFSAGSAVGEVRAVQESIADFMVGVGIRTVAPDLVERLPLPVNRRFDAASDRLERAIRTVIATYREEGDDHHDILSMLMAARDAEGRPMSDRELRDEVLSLVVAGGDTTGHVLGWAFHEIARHPDVERELHDELRDVLSGRAVTTDDLPKLTYIQRVIKECLRLRNPGWIMMRRATKDVRLGRYAIPEGAELMVSGTSMLRDPALWPEPDRFDPDRWLPERAKEVPREAYMPFGVGTRQCAGEHLSRMTMAVVLATIPARFRFRPVPGHRVKEVPLGTMSANALPMTLEAR